MPFTKVGKLSDLPPGNVLEANVGGRQYAICNVGGQLHAVDGACPHREGPLGQGALHGTTLVCPWHAWEYDCTTGENTYDSVVKLQKFDVKVDGEDILIDTNTA